MIARHGKLPLLGDPADRSEHWFTAFGGSGPTQYVASFNDTEALRQAAAQGQGVAPGRRMLAQPLTDSGRLVVLTRKRLEYPPSAAWSSPVAWRCASGCWSRLRFRGEPGNGLGCLR